MFTFMIALSNHCQCITNVYCAVRTYGSSEPLTDGDDRDRKFRNNVIGADSLTVGEKVTFQLADDSKTKDKVFAKCATRVTKVTATNRVTTVAARQLRKMTPEPARLLPPSSKWARGSENYEPGNPHSQGFIENFPVGVESLQVVSPPVAPPSPPLCLSDDQQEPRPMSDGQDSTNRQDSTDEFDPSRPFWEPAVTSSEAEPWL